MYMTPAGIAFCEELQKKCLVYTLCYQACTLKTEHRVSNLYKVSSQQLLLHVT